MSEKIYHYVPHHEEKVWEAAGWVYCQELGPPHAAYASLWMWPHDREPVIPARRPDGLFDADEREKNLRDFDNIWGISNEED